MASYRVATVNEDKRPIAGVVVEAVSLNSWPDVSATATTGRNGTVQFTGLVGPHFFRPRVRRTSATVGGRIYTGVVEIQIVHSGGESLNVDYVVDSNGMGTHTELFSGDGALEDAIATGGDRVIWICSGHSESIATTHALTNLADGQEITVLSAGINRPSFTIHADLSTDALINHGTANSGGPDESKLRFQGVSFTRPDAASAGPWLTGTGGYITPKIELIDVTFSGAAANWTAIFDFTGTGSANVHDILLERVMSDINIGAVVSVGAGLGGVGKFAMNGCDFASLGYIEKRDAATTMDVGYYGISITDNIFRVITGYGWRRAYPTGGSDTHPFVFSGNIVLDHQASSFFIAIGTIGTTSPTDATINGNFIRCSSDHADTRAVLITGGAGTAENISICGNSLQGPGGAQAHIAVDFAIQNTGCHVCGGFRDWDTDVGGASVPDTDVAGDLCIAGDAGIAGYLRVGSCSAPTNTTAGDITGIRALLGTDESFGPDTLFNITKASFTPSSGDAAIVDLDVTVAPNADAPGANSNDAFRLNVAVQPSAASAHRNVGLRFDVAHDSGAYDLTSPTALLGIQGGVVQNVGSTTVANTSGLRGFISATAGTITTSRIFDARMGTAGDAGDIGTEIGYDIIVNATPSGGVTNRYGLRIPALVAGGVTTPIGIYLEDAGIKIAPDDEAAILLDGGDWTPGGAMGIGEVGGTLYIQGRNNMTFVIDPANGGARNFYWYCNNDLATGTLLMQLTEAGQLQLPITGAGAGILIGGDTQWYRAAADVMATPDTVRIGADLDHDGSNVGFFGVTPAARAGAYTQTYSTADKTHANPTAAAVGDLVATSGGWGYSTEANADKVWDALDKLVADMADVKQLVNAVIDDLQAYGLFQ